MACMTVKNEISYSPTPPPQGCGCEVKKYISYSPTPPPQGCQVNKERCPSLVEKYLDMNQLSLVKKTIEMFLSSMNNNLRLNSDYLIKKLSILLSSKDDEDSDDLIKKLSIFFEFAVLQDKEIVISFLKRLREQIIQDPQFNNNKKDELLKMIEKAIKDLEGIKRHRCDNCGSRGCNGC